MQEQYKVSDKQIIESIKYHTSGMEEMDEIFMTVFLADKLDPKKIEKNIQLEPINQTALSSLSEATLMYLNLKISITLFIIFFFLFCIFWIFLLGFGSPLCLVSGFLFGQLVGTLICFGFQVDSPYPINLQNQLQF